MSDEVGADYDDVEVELVMGMPRRELYAVSGFSSQLTLPVLESLQEEHWFALPQVLADDIDAKEVRIALLIRREGQWLVEESGVLLHAAPVHSNVTAFGYGLVALKELAKAAGGELMGTSRVRITLHGYLNEDRLDETRPYFILVYILDVPSGSAAPDGMTWVGTDHLDELTLDPPSLLVVQSCNHG